MTKARLDEIIRQAGVSYYGEGDSRAHSSETHDLIRIGIAIAWEATRQDLEEQLIRLGDLNKEIQVES